MKSRVFSTMVLLAFLAFVFSAQARSEDASPTASESVTTENTEPSPHIVFDQMTHDFGEMKQQQSVEYIFNFSNTGDALLVVNDVKSSCGCTGTLLSSKEIQPGEKGEIKVTFNSGYKQGAQHKTISVYSNDPQRPTIQLHITADISVPVLINPRQLTWMADRDVKSIRTVQLLYQPDLHIKIASLETTSPAFTASATPITDGEKPGYNIAITFNGTYPSDRLKEKLTINTDNTDYPVFQVPIYGTVTGKIKVIPNAVALGVISDGELPTRSIRIFSKDRSLDFKITSIESSSPLILTQIERDEDVNGYRVNVSLSAKPPVGAFAEELVITTNLEDESPSKLAVYAFVKGPEQAPEN